VQNIGNSTKVFQKLKINLQAIPVVDLDIKGFFDNIDHNKLMLAVEKHIPDNWVKLYIKRWLEAPVVTKS
jgi:retron-type reverse transcriptase